MKISCCSKKTLGGGTVLDLGVYTIQVAQWAFDEAPTSITASGTLNDEGCDLAMNAVLSYGGDRVANIATSALKQLDNVAVITGTKGQIIVSIYCHISYTRNITSKCVFSMRAFVERLKNFGRQPLS